MAEIQPMKVNISYRPEGWTNPYGSDCSWEMAKMIFEAGADAMLNLLLKEAQDYNETAHHYMRHDDYLCDILAQGLKIR
ncbi:MAG: hypothetical protein WB588_06910 [Dehalococcoidia bacterium]